MIIKEFYKSQNRTRYIVREMTSYSGLDKFERLFEIAKKDFPNLSSSDVEITHYGGRNYSGTFGIEFYAENHAPNDYREVSQLELTL